MGNNRDAWRKRTVSLSLWGEQKNTVDKQRDGEGGRLLFVPLTPILAAQEVQAGGENDEALKKEREREEHFFCPPSLIPFSPSA